MKIAEQLAVTWIECWNRGDPDAIPLAESFTHTSPFGRVAGREEYLEWVKPLARQNVTELKILRTLGDDEQAVIHFVMQTPGGPVEVCDWIVADGDRIAAIHSFYDASGLREPGQDSPPGS